MEALKSEVIEPYKLKTMHVFCLGKGPVGSNLVNQILETQNEIESRRRLVVKVIGVADSKFYILNKEGVSSTWRSELAFGKNKNNLDEIVDRIQELDLENIVIADNTASQDVTDFYPAFLNAGFDIVASNKKLNSGEYLKYEEVRKLLEQQSKSFYYETNVGAGLPVIDTLKQLTDAAESITRIRGIFSGSLSYLFNTFSNANRPFSEILLEAKEKGLTEADPREDLSGLDVARKLIILSREVGLKVDLEDVEVENLIPETLSQAEDFEAFLEKRDLLDKHFQNKYDRLSKGKVLRYVGELNVKSKELNVSLIEVYNDSPLGNVKGSDSIFEVYTEDYGEQPLVIQGAGAGGKVTARGVYSDIIRVGRASQLN